MGFLDFGFGWFLGFELGGRGGGKGREKGGGKRGGGKTQRVTPKTIHLANNKQWDFGCFDFWILELGILDFGCCFCDIVGVAVGDGVGVVGAVVGDAVVGIVGFVVGCCCWCGCCGWC